MSTEVTKDHSHVIGGYKATLTNPHASDKAKDQAEAMLDKLEADQPSSGSENKDPSHVIGGLKSAVTNPNNSLPAKEHAIETLEEMNVSAPALGGPINDLSDGKNPGNVAGGLKAALNNPNVSQDGKEKAAEKLDGMI